MACTTQCMFSKGKRCRCSCRGLTHGIWKRTSDIPLNDTKGGDKNGKGRERPAGQGT